MHAELRHRLARSRDLENLRALMELAIGELQQPFLSATQIEASRLLMGLDTQLVDDGTYFVVDIDTPDGAVLAGCGGWSRRATLYGGDQTPGRSPALLDPARDAARVRAMYTHPAHARKGVGRLILALCEDAARREGFTRVELMATLSGEPLYRACGYEVLEAVVDERGGAPVPLLRMAKRLARAQPAPSGSALPARDGFGHHAAMTTRPHADLLARLARVDATHLADADKRIRACDAGLVSLRHGLKLLGRAHTVRCCEDFLTVIAGLAAAEPGDVLVIDTQGSRRAVLGELFSLEAARKGLAGIVVDGLVRDTSTIRTLDLPVYARGTCPQAGTINRYYETQVPVSIGGVIVNPGDLLFGDDDGLLVATPAEVAAALPQAETIAAREAQLIAQLRAGVALGDMVNAAEHLENVKAGRPSALRFDI